jgi:hypothetical protein
MIFKIWDVVAWSNCQSLLQWEFILHYNYYYIRKFEIYDHKRTFKLIHYVVGK